MKVLVIGASGFLGKKIMRVLSADFELYGTAHSQKSNELYILDITNKDRVIGLLEKLKPGIVIHTAGITNVDKCETGKKEAFEANVEGTKNIVDACKRIKAKLVYASTD